MSMPNVRNPVRHKNISSLNKTCDKEENASQLASYWDLDWYSARGLMLRMGDDTTEWTRDKAGRTSKIIRTIYTSYGISMEWNGIPSETELKEKINNTTQIFGRGGLA